MAVPSIQSISPKFNQNVEKAKKSFVSKKCFQKNANFKKRKHKTGIDEVKEERRIQNFHSMGIKINGGSECHLAEKKNLFLMHRSVI